MSPEMVATEAFAAREIRLPFARDQDGDSPAVHVAVSASGERVVVLRRDGADGVVYDVGADRLRALPAGGEVEGPCALRHAPVAIAWWNDGGDLLYVAIDLERGALDGPWLVAGGATLVVVWVPTTLAVKFRKRWRAGWDRWGCRQEAPTELLELTEGSGDQLVSPQLGADGLLRVAYYRESAGEPVLATELAGGTWSYEIVDDNTRIAGFELQPVLLHVDAAGESLIAFRDQAGGGTVASPNP